MWLIHLSYVSLSSPSLPPSLSSSPDVSVQIACYMFGMSPSVWGDKPWNIAYRSTILFHSDEWRFEAISPRRGNTNRCFVFRSRSRVGLDVWFSVSVVSAPRVDWSTMWWTSEQYNQVFCSSVPLRINNPFITQPWTPSSPNPEPLHHPTPNPFITQPWTRPFINKHWTHPGFHWSNHICRSMEMEVGALHTG